MPKTHPFPQALVLLLVFLSTRASGLDVDSCLAAAAPAPRVAILPFGSKTVGIREREFLRQAIADTLVQRGADRPMPGNAVDSVLSGMGISQADPCTDTACARIVGGHLGVDQILQGDLEALGSALIITLRLVDVETGGILGSARDSRYGTIESVVPRSVPRLVEVLGATSGSRALQDTSGLRKLSVRLLLRERMFLDDTGLIVLSSLTRNEPEPVRRDLYKSAASNWKWAFASAYPFVPAGTIAQGDHMGLAYIGSVYYVAVFFAVIGIDNPAPFFYFAYGFQVARPAWYGYWHNRELGKSLHLGKTAWSPSPTVQRLRDGTLAPALAWTF